MKTDKVNVSDDFWAPSITHDKCDTTELDSLIKCDMNDGVLQCSMTSCGGEKYSCDCNVYDEWLAFDPVFQIFILF